LIYGDYDVDGTSGSAVLGLFLSELGMKVSYRQPSRFENGYGLHSELLQEEISNGEKHLLISVDCGISDTKAVSQARKMGFQIIVTDHHQPPDTLPDADAIINPWQLGCDFPFKELAGVGVAFYLAMGVRSKLNEKNHWKNSNPPNLRKYLDLVCLGTIGDLVPLVGVNRILAKAGLMELAVRKRPGTKWLLNLAGISGKEVSSEDVSFQLAPRINAAGRLGRADNALELLITSDENSAKKCAEKLEQANKTRKEIEKEIFQLAYEMFESDSKEMPNSIIVYGENWNRGILGIVASRLVRMFYRPTIVFSIENGFATGSARSIPGINILEVLQGSESLLESYGGHKAAAGAKLKASNIQPFKQKFEEIISGLLEGQKPVPELHIS